VRIAIVSWSRRRVGGVEGYLARIVAQLVRAGHPTGFWHELNEPVAREEISLPSEVPSWCAAELGAERALAELRAWRPAVIYAHGLVNPELEAETLRVAPGIFFAHGYYGTCISGSKTFKLPVATPCSRRFGWECLVHYFPRRCGGWSPLTMLREYWRQAKRRELLSHYGAIVTLSEHMRAEYVRNGFPASRIHKVPYDLTVAGSQRNRDHAVAGLNMCSSQVGGALGGAPDGVPKEKAYCKLVFLGRMDFLKGGDIFLDALQQVGESSDRPLRVIFAGDGPERERWERRSARLQASNPNLDIHFVGWVALTQLDVLFADCDLLVVPSLWPEPFGQVGIEAACRGVPAAAFAVGGITEWLKDGVSGHLAAGDPPTAVGLAEAIVKCLRNRAAHAQLRLGAIDVSHLLGAGRHVESLLEIFEKVLHGGADRAGETRHPWGRQ
jgi:glycosyltransferase involved in cell wall biosynthesis